MSAILKALQNRTVNVELKSEVVEFAGVKDVSKGIATFNSDTKKIKDGYDKLIKFQSDLQRQYDSLISGRKKLITEMLTFEKKAKELGVDPNSIPEYKKAKGEFKDAEKNRMAVAKVLAT